MNDHRLHADIQSNQAAQAKLIQQKSENEMVLKVSSCSRHLLTSCKVFRGYRSARLKSCTTSWQGATIFRQPHPEHCNVICLPKCFSDALCGGNA